MESFVAIVHILVAFILIALVLVQDSKSGSIGVFGGGGGGGSNSVLGATGATTLAQKMTRWVAAIFAVTCISLSIFSVRSRSSVLDSLPATAVIPGATSGMNSGAVAPTGEAAPTGQAAPTGEAAPTAPTGP